jgi:hypothetical protein
LTCLTHSPLPPQVPQRLAFLLGGMGGSEDVEIAAIDDFPLLTALHRGLILMLIWGSFFASLFGQLLAVCFCFEGCDLDFLCMHCVLGVPRGMGSLPGVFSVVCASGFP